MVKDMFQPCYNWGKRLVLLEGKHDFMESFEEFSWRKQKQSTCHVFTEYSPSEYKYVLRNYPVITLSVHGLCPVSR